MKHRHMGGPGRHEKELGAFDHHDHHRGRRHGRRGGRPFDYGELRLLLIAMIAEKPSHGYELIKAVEERMGGSYSPSPGVIYPTLSWLDDMGYATLDVQEGGRKRYRITPEGEAFLVANRGAVDELLARAVAGGPRRAGVPHGVIRAMENLKLAVRLRLRSGPVDEQAAERIAATLDEAARHIAHC